jgi:hypothetical protein
VLDAIIKSRPDSLTPHYTRIIDILTERLKERDENVKLDIFTTFSNLIRSILVGDVEGIENDELPGLFRTRSSAISIYEQVPSIIDAVLKELG